MHNKITLFPVDSAEDLAKIFRNKILSPDSTRYHVNLLKQYQITSNNNLTRE